MWTKMMPDGIYQSIYRDITERKQAELFRELGREISDTKRTEIPGVYSARPLRTEDADRSRCRAYA